MIGVADTFKDTAAAFDGAGRGDVVGEAGNQNDIERRRTGKTSQTTLSAHQEDRTPPVPI
jgi:hypothetical protein